MSGREVLTIVRDLLVIVACIVFLYAAYQVQSGLSALQDGLGGGTSDLPDECWTNGAGQEICAPGGEDGQ